MLSVLANRTYRHLLAAQIIALLGTGLATIALGLLAWQIAGEQAGVVLGTALAIKMLAYVGLAPVASALADRLPRRVMLVSLDLIRAAVALALPFVTEIWHIYSLIFLMQAASAGFTPTFQATIPDVLPDEAEYTRALSLSRLAYDLESLLSPMLAATLLTIVSFPVLFGGTVIGFLASALLVVSVPIPSPQPSTPRGIWDRTTRGIRLYFATPRLRGLLALNLVVAAASAMVLVNTVVLVKGRFALSEPQVAIALAAFGGGSMVAALLLPRVLDHMPDRPPMLAGGALLTIGLWIGPWADSFNLLVALWALLGFGFSLAQTPVGRLLRRSALPEDRPALFAAQFALSHACWLLTYPLAGQIGARAGFDATFLLLGTLAGGGLLLATKLWHRDADFTHQIEAAAHDHSDLPPDHPHLATYGHGPNHRHPVVVDDLHPRT
ncbi:MFS transporter [Phaeobacter gallaeciensis]|uniref:Transporter, MFS family n=1 Tax=Phaeobacter gallaeciensis TaxID=60890 RepID=A0AAD0EEM4_9RHOB|nr:MFS transporter [Phaeobacter gallaeciensis]AHD11451.1 Arabinose efflux permease [Phaeobacter gallaeciensis DSM 26640]ATE94715.1 putative transporter, MFS family [Phaeobacter gallaeciensis]ATE98987.1 putative transporter, MFS family [Phaeobacter gallaeciensis]ATF03379.1 putative transporter, MFS family [Phaeobacter gallaeciensis]ATF07759.1 putative transporter, MFS family [Phaeobacter gallaeciensis]